MSTFIINRMDGEIRVDEVRIEAEALFIGSAPVSILQGEEHYLALKAPEVPARQARIEKKDNNYWLWNIAAQDATFYNEQAIKSPVVIHHGDVIDIGRFRLSIHLVKKFEWAIEITVQVTKGEDYLPPSEDWGKIHILSEKPPVVFEDLVKDFAGKVRIKKEYDPLDTPVKLRSKKRDKSPESHASTPPHHWHRTRDLKSGWRKLNYLIVPFLVGTATALTVYYNKHAFSAGPISTAHTSAEVSSRRIAVQPNNDSCFGCHAITSHLSDKCASCHTTEQFKPSIYKKHKDEVMDCNVCHTDHKGEKSEAGLVTYSICSDCHNGVYIIKAGDRRGKILAVPHSGDTGYPRDDSGWTWKGLDAEGLNKKGLPANWAEYERYLQFHLVHQKGRLLNKIRCTDCHTNGPPVQGGRDDAPRAVCADCHAIRRTATGFEPIKPNCITCHQQHGQSEDAARLVDAAASDGKRIKEYLDALNSGKELGVDPKGDGGQTKK
jgi:FHA domain-containing protein